MASPASVLITGAQGFVGAHLVKALKVAGHAAHGPELDLFKPETLARALGAADFDWVIHLAALSHVPSCERDPELARRTNIDGTVALLEAMRQSAPRARLLFASTAQVYAAPDADEARSETVFDEGRRIEPQNLYARTKREAEQRIEEAAGAGGPGATVLRLFNHSHKTQSPDFFLPHLYQQMRQAPAGAPVRVPVGDLELRRDFGAVQDLVAAMASLVARARPSTGVEVFNVCGGRARHLRALAEGLARAMRVDAEFVREESRIRPGEPRAIRGSHARLTAATGWTPRAGTDPEFLGAFLADL